MQDLKLATGMNIILKEVNKDIIKTNMDIYYSQDLKSDENYAENLFHQILKIAMSNNASDIHIEPFKEYFIIRNRIVELRRLTSCFQRKQLIHISIF